MLHVCYYYVLALDIRKSKNDETHSLRKKKYINKLRNTLIKLLFVKVLQK